MNFLSTRNNGRVIALVALLSAQALILLRTAVIARLLGPEQFGIAATFILLQQFLESSTDAGMNKYILSAKSGHQKTTIATLHSIAFWRSTVLAVLVMAVAFPLFIVNGLVDSFLPFFVIGLALVANGLSNLDMLRMQRQDNLKPSSYANIGAEVTATVVAAIILQFDRSFMVAIYTILAKQAGVTLISHVLSRRPYRQAYADEATKRIWKFSTPLILNGLLLFFASQADRLVIAMLLPPATLGIYTAVLLLIYTPSSVIARYLGTIFLPMLSRQIHLQGRPNQRLFGCIIIIVASGMVLGFGLLGTTFVFWIFGPGYKIGWLPVALIGISQALRFARLWPSTVALAYGFTGSLLAATAVRTMVIPLSLIGLWWDGGITGLCFGIFAGEAIALAFSFWNNNRNTYRKGVRESLLSD